MVQIMIEEKVVDKINDKNDETIRTIKEEKQLPYCNETKRTASGSGATL